MTLDVYAQHRIWAARCYINGQPQRLAQPLPSRRIGFDTARSTAEAFLIDVPATQTGQAAFVDVGWNGELVRLFTGRIDQPSANQPALNRKITLVDENGKLRKRLTTNITWDNRNFVDAVFDVLQQVGADRVSYVYDPGLVLGPNYPITIDASKESAAEVFRQLLEYGGCTAWVAPDGGMRIDNITPIPASSYATLPDGTPMIYAYGATGWELGLTGSAFSMANAEGLTSSVTITGPKRADGVTPTGSATLPAEGESYSAQLRYVQNSVDAQSIAVRELSKRGVTPVVVSVTAPFNPYILPGQTIGFRDERLGYNSTAGAFVWSVSNNGPEMTLTLYVGTHVADGYTGPQPPVAVATLVHVEQEPVLVAGVEETAYFVQMDGSASYTPTGSIVLYDWSAPGASPSTSTEQRPLFVYDDITGRTITLTVTSDTGQINTVSVVVPTAAADIVTRQLSVAEGASGWAVLLDATGWQSLTRGGQSCTAVPSFNEGGPLLSGWSDGAIYTLDTSTVPATLVARGTVTGSVACVFVNEENRANVLVCAGTKLYRSSSGGASFTLLYDFGVGNTTRDAQSSPSNVNEIRVAAGEKTYVSFDGATFTAAISGASGTTAGPLASAPWGHACVFSGGASATDALKFEEGYGVAWTEVVSPPTSLTSIYPLLTTPGFVAGDGAGNLYLISQVGVNFNATSIPVSYPGAAIPDAIRDGQLDGLAFLATTAGALKLVNNATLYALRANAALQIGYGALSSTVIHRGARVYLFPSGASGAADRIWVLDTTNETWSDIVPPVSGWNWLSFDISPLNSNHWLLLGNRLNSPLFDVQSGKIVGLGTSTPVLWVSTDGGATWTGIDVTHPYVTTLATSPGTSDPPLFSKADIQEARWSTSESGAWSMVGGDDDAMRYWFHRGDLTNATLQGTYETAMEAINVVAGVGTDVITEVGFAGGYRGIRYAAGATWTTTPGTTDIGPNAVRMVRGFGTSSRADPPLSDGRPADLRDR